MCKLCGKSLVWKKRSFGPVEMLARTGMVNPLSEVVDFKLTERQENRQQHSGIGFIDATVRGCLEGAPLVINKSSLVFFNESPFDATPEKWMIETHCGSLPIAVTTSVMSIHSLANAGSKDDLQKICMHVQQEARNYLYDKWQHGGDIQGIEKKKEPTRDVRPEIPTTDWKLMKVMDHCLVPLQSTIDKYSTTKHAAELQAILAKNTEQYNPEGKIHNDATRACYRMPSSCCCFRASKTVK